jgi:cytochrome P450
MNIPNMIAMYGKAMNGRLIEFTNETYDKYGNTFRFPLFGQPSLSTSSPENIKTILATRFEDFELGTKRYNNMSSLLGEGIFSVDGTGWATARALMKPQFAKTQIMDLSGLEENTEMFLECLQDDVEVEIQVLFHFLTMDNATELLFGESVGSLKVLIDSNRPRVDSPDRKQGSIEEKVSGAKTVWDFPTAFNVAQIEVGHRFMFGKLGWLYNPKRLRETTEYIHRFIDDYVVRAIARHEKKRKQPEEGNPKKRFVFLEALVEETQNIKVLRDQLLSILLAGRDTTACLLSWTIWTLSRRPEIYKALRASVPKDTVPTYASIKENTYLRNVINEVLRLYPVVPLNSRTARKDTILPEGGGEDGNSPVYVTKGTIILYSVHTLHRRKDIWGDDAGEFVPERWNTTVKPWRFIPFNGGPRICIGRKFNPRFVYIYVMLMEIFTRAIGAYNCRIRAITDMSSI